MKCCPCQHRYEEQTLLRDVTVCGRKYRFQAPGMRCERCGDEMLLHRDAHIAELLIARDLVNSIKLTGYAFRYAYLAAYICPLIAADSLCIALSKLREIEGGGGCLMGMGRELLASQIRVELHGLMTLASRVKLIGAGALADAA